MENRWSCNNLGGFCYFLERWGPAGNGAGEGALYAGKNVGTG